MILIIQYNTKIKSSNESKETDIKNHGCYYFDDIININNTYLVNISINQKSCENVLIYNFA